MPDPIEPIDDDALAERLSAILARKRPRNDALDEEGRYRDGTYKGMTPAEVIRQRDAYRRIVGE